MSYASPGETLKRFISNGEMSGLFWPLFGLVGAQSGTSWPAVLIASARQGDLEVTAKSSKVARKRT